MIKRFQWLNEIFETDLDTDSKEGYKIRHFRVCFVAMTIGYIFLTMMIVIVDSTGESFFGDKVLGRCLLNIAIYSCLLLVSYHSEKFRKNIEMVAVVSFFCTTIHSILAIRYNPYSEGYWVAGAMTYVAATMMLISRRTILFFSVGVLVTYPLASIGSPDPNYKMLLFFEIAVVILGFISWTVVPKEIWAFRALGAKDEHITRLSMQKFLLAQISHDLKTPLVSLIALLPRAKDKIKVEDAEWREMFDVMMESAHLVQALVEKTTIFRDISSGRMTPRLETFQLSHLVDICHRIAAPLKRDRRMKFTNSVDTALFVMADRLMIEQVLVNLFTNSIKYSSEHILEVQVQSAIKDGWISVRVVDNGIGMTPEQAKHAFELFYRGDTARTDLTSSGLGLAISKEIILLHGGEIFVEKTSPGNGTSVVFTLKMGVA